MTRSVVAALYVWDEYPGLRAGRLYAGGGDIGRHPRGETHVVAGVDATKTVCELPRDRFPHRFAESVNLADADPCPDCGIGSQPGRPSP